MTFHDKNATQVTNITLNVSDLKNMIKFYTQILGLTIKHETNHAVTFNVGAHGHTLTLNEIENGRRPSMRESGLFHMALLLPTRQVSVFSYIVLQVQVFKLAVAITLSGALYFATLKVMG